jgi:lantibiotic modifying enzyme
LDRISELSPGLYIGASGMALALAEGITSSLLEDNESQREKMLSCLEMQTEEINVVDGIAGQGIALLQCSSLLKKDSFQHLLNRIVDQLLSKQQKDGSWPNHFGKKRKSAGTFDFNYDDTGIIWFLLDYISLCPNSEAEHAIRIALDTIRKDKALMNQFHDLVATRTSYEQGDGGKGMLLMFLKSYQVLQENSYKQIAEKALYKFPASIVNPNFTQQNGLAGMGELYLEAWQVLKNEEWKLRADWIANVFLHTFFKKEEDSGYWVMDQNNPPTADLLQDVSGIIHFLARCFYPQKMGYRLLK